MNMSSIYERFQSDLTNAIYNAIADTCFKYHDDITDPDAICDAVDSAVDFWDVHFWDSDDWMD